MICKVCLGKGWILNENYTERIKCPACHGTKETDPTNEEWLKSKDTADLAEWIYNAMFNKSCQEDVADGAYMQMMTKKDYIESWLSEVHTE